MPERHAVGGKDYSGKCFVCHSNCLAEAEQTAQALRERFPRMQPIRICDIGCIIAAHSGPGTVAAFFLGDPRAPEKKKRERIKRRSPAPPEKERRPPLVL